MGLEVSTVMDSFGTMRRGEILLWYVLEACAITPWMLDVAHC
jgi:hypothetical protein